MDKLVIGILAHVDAGKTTLSEALMYKTGAIKNLGRVDHKDAVLDTYSLERERGITIFSKQAVFSTKKHRVFLLDTPGHIDFQGEAERTLQVLDYALLLISASEGVQSHTKTLWDLLFSYHIPTIIFVNKMDQTDRGEDELIRDIKEHLGDTCISFSSGQSKEDFYENLATADEELLEKYIETNTVSNDDITRMIKEQKVTPCFFGSALKLRGIDELINGLDTYAVPPIYPSAFGAAAFKIQTADDKIRLTYLKITGGELKVRDRITPQMIHSQRADSGILRDSAGEDKIDQIRIYSGSKYQTVESASAGTVCAVTGLHLVRPGDGIGIEAAGPLPLLKPILTYRVIVPDYSDPHTVLGYLRQLESEEPNLNVVFDEKLQEIQVRLMGEVQTEILKSIIKERFRVAISFDSGSVLYKETIVAPVVGSGHFEPLRHYAEVHLLLTPGERGSGLTVCSSVRDDVLDKNFVSLIETHLTEKEYTGVLLGAPLTDVKVTIIGGRSHIKHTEGGDFREATYRAVRQALMKAESILLEPYFSFRLELPITLLGRAMTDMKKASGTFDTPGVMNDTAILTGEAPAVNLKSYPVEFMSYTGGLGRIFLKYIGYKACHNSEEVIESVGYDAEGDTENPASSVFCSHGSGTLIPWDEADSHMHVLTESLDAARKKNLPLPGRQKEEARTEGNEARPAYRPKPASKEDVKDSYASEKELKEIFERTFGSANRGGSEISGNRNNRRVYTKTSADEQSDNQTDKKTNNRAGRQITKKAAEYLLVDGYNIIFGWEDLSALAEKNIDGAREKLIDTLSNYQGYKKCELILVFDAYRIEGHPEEISLYKNLHVVYTKEAETADQYIEKTVKTIAGSYHVTVATSDHLEQIIVFGSGARVISARDFEKEVSAVENEIRLLSNMHKEPGNKNYLLNHASKELSEKLEEVRLGKKKL